MNINIGNKSKIKNSNIGTNNRIENSKDKNSKIFREIIVGLFVTVVGGIILYFILK